MKNDVGKKLLREMREIVTAKGKSADANSQIYQSGLNHFVNEDFEQAVMIFHQIIKLNPDFAFSHYYLGRSLRRIEKYQEAIAAFEQSIKLNPLHAPSYAYLGDVFLRKNNFVKAEENFRQALNLQFDNLTALSGLANLFKKTNQDFNEITDLLKNAYFQGGKNPLILMELLSIQSFETKFYLQIGDEQLAQKSYYRAVFFYRLALHKEPENKIIRAKIEETLSHLKG
ncbi:MAG: tetratricopeptide repeat protein [Pyrinomonadaceae bacterium]|nr:tetratricopeptide repeat protein [Pyrinomonadaceae bacterium]